MEYLIYGFVFIIGCIVITIGYILKFLYHLKINKEFFWCYSEGHYYRYPSKYHRWVDEMSWKDWK